MTDDSEPFGKPFGELYPITHDRFGQAAGGAAGGGFHWLLEEADRERGFFSEPDRRLLLTSNWDGDLADATERNARLRIRNRVLSSYFDARYLRYIRDQDRKILFANARDAGYDLHFREGFKEFVRFTYLGLLEQETDVDVQEILEAAIREAETEHAVASGENVDVQVDIDVTRLEERGVEELEEAYHQRKNLDRQELAVLVNSQHRNGDENVEDAADIDLADALYYSARQPESDPHGYSWEDPDREEAEEIVEWLRSVFEEYDISSYDNLDVDVDRLSLADEDLGEELREKLSRLPRAAPDFESQLDLGVDLPESDMELLHHILYNPDNIDVETALVEEARPRTAGEDWDPAEDEYLQKFVARVEAHGSPAGGERGRERWQEVLEVAEFDEDEWSEYMREQRVTHARKALQEDVDTSETLTVEELQSAGTAEEVSEILYRKGGEEAYWLTEECEEDVLTEAIRSLTGSK